MYKIEKNDSIVFVYQNLKLKVSRGYFLSQATSMIPMVGVILINVLIIYDNSIHFDVPCLLYEILYFSLFLDNKVSNSKNLICDQFSVRSIPTHTIVISSFTLVNRDKVKVHTLHIPLILFLLLSWNKEQIKLVKHPTTRMCTYVVIQRSSQGFHKLQGCWRS